MIYTRGVQTAARDVLIKTKFEADWKPRPFLFFREQLDFRRKTRKPEKFIMKINIFRDYYNAARQ